MFILLQDKRKTQRLESAKMRKQRDVLGIASCMGDVKYFVFITLNTRHGFFMNWNTESLPN